MVSTPGYLGYLKYMYYFLMAWAIITIYTSECAQMIPKSFVIGQHFSPDAKSVISKKPYGVGTTSPWWPEG